MSTFGNMSNRERKTSASFECTLMIAQSNQALDKCVALLGTIESGGAAAGRARLRAVHAGALYNDLGLAYMRNRQFPRAAECFEQALPHLRAERRLELVQKCAACLCLSRCLCTQEHTREPVLRTVCRFEPLIEQNLGAAYNAVGDYQRALPFHKRALDRYGTRALHSERYEYARFQ